MRQVNANELAAFASPAAEHHVKLRIEDAFVPDVLGYDPTVTWQLDVDLDRPAQQLRVAAHLGLGSTNISPMVASGAVLHSRPLFDVGRQIEFWIQSCQPGDFQPSNADRWFPLFRGYIDDADPGGDSDLLNIQARCLVGLYLDKMIDVRTSTPDGLNFGFTVMNHVDAGDAMDEILAKSYGVGGAPGTPPVPFLREAAPLGVTSYFQDGTGSVYDAMNRIGLQNGYALLGLWDRDIVGSYNLCYVDPKRDRTAAEADWVMGPARYYGVRALPISRRNIRNRIWVTPADGTRIAVMAEDTSSQIDYGEQVMFVSEDRTSHIISSSQASALAANALSDLARPKVSLEIEAPCMWAVEINDVWNFSPNAIPAPVHYGDTLTLGISGYTHSGDNNGHASTVLRTRGKPSAANKAWTNQPGPKLQYVALTPPVGGAVRGARWAQVADLTPP